MNRNLRCLIIFISAAFLIWAYQQDDYSLNNQFIRVAYLNHSWMPKFIIENVKPNRTYRALNIYIELKRIMTGNKLKVNVQAYWFLSNEYKKSPILFDVPFCRMMQTRNFGIQELFEKGNCTNCPLLPGVYIIKDFALKEKYFPPFIPEGEYMFLIKIRAEDVILVELKWYGSIVSRRNLRTEKP